MPLLFLNFSVAATAYLSALLITHYNYQVEKIKLKLKTTLVLIIYQKSLNVGLTGRSFMSGNALNLMTSDVDRVANFCTSFHMFWSLPLQIIVTLYMLYTQASYNFFMLHVAVKYEYFFNLCIQDFLKVL